MLCCLAGLGKSDTNSYASDDDDDDDEYDSTA